MCTLIISWNKNKLIVGANRDEVFTRPSEDFKYRGNISCPLDVRGGTWIGVNNKGVFAGLTNLDEYINNGGSKKSRGKLVIDALLAESSLDAVNTIMTKEDPERYKGCVLLVADKNNFHYIVFTGVSMISESLEPGLHISTGWGLDKWNIHRSNYVRNKFTDETSLKQILKYHGNFEVESEICVHDPKETHQTRSSCIITSDWEEFTVEHSDFRPCDTKIWKTKKVLVNEKK